MKRQIKVGIVVSEFPPTAIGGTQIATKHLAKYLSKKGLEVHLITRNTRIKIKGKKYSLKKKELYNGYVLHRISCSTIPLFRFITHTLFGLKALLQIKPDIIHGQQLTPNGFIAVLAGKILRKKTIVSTRGSEIYNSSLLYLRSLGNFIISHANIVLSVSEHMKTQMKQLWPQKPIYILHNGIDYQNYSHDPTPKTIIKLIYVGRLIKTKRVIDAITAFSELKDEFPKIGLDIIGSGSQKEILKKECERLGVKNSVQFLGNLSHKLIPKYLSVADIFVFPSPKEGFSNAILEAMASSLPIIAPRSTSIPELVHDQVNGLLYSSENIQELIKHLKHLIQDAALRESMGGASRKIAERFSWKKIVNRLLEFYFNK